MNILLLGKNGQVGWELQRALAPLGKVIAHDRASADFEKIDLLRRMVRDVAPDILVNAAAFTAVDRAEMEVSRAEAVNARAVEMLAMEMLRCRGWMVHYSTDYVFDGTKTSPYVESDTPRPQSTYGKTKLAGERAIVESGCRHLVFRTSWVYSGRGGNFVKTMLKLARERDEIKVVSDQVGAPTGADLVANVTALTLHQLVRAPAVAVRASGIYHLTARGSTSWHAYAQMVIDSAAQAGAPVRVKPERVLPIKTSEYPTPAPRPANSRLNCSKVCNTFELTMPSWEDGVRRLMTELNEATKT